MSLREDCCGCVALNIHTVLKLYKSVVNEITSSFMSFQNVVIYALSLYILDIVMYVIYILYNIISDILSTYCTVRTRESFLVGVARVNHCDFIVISLSFLGGREVEPLLRLVP